MEITQFNQLNLDKLYTYTDYLSWKFEERVELLKGKIFKMAAPSSRHQSISSLLTSRFIYCLEDRPCQIFAAPFDVRLPIPKGNKLHTVVQPDLCVICDDSKIDIRGAIGAPDLVVEILSPNNSKTDLHDKFYLYQEAKIKEYWIVYPIEKLVILHSLNQEGKYYVAKSFSEDERLKSFLFQDLEFNLEKIFDFSIKPHI